uniref:Transporter n=2 Tax=Acrobeloides nanus TaxID=290746 RepID=A0A914DR86_9BILA
MPEPVVERTQWNSQTQFLLSCIGYAVGLGNIWRFPSLAYENGGGAFLIPYLCCSFFFGLPILYLELSLGQFAKAGPAVVYGRIRPLFHGVGWGMSALSLLVAIYYNVIVAWVLIYLFVVVTGRYHQWSSCMNDFNTIYCASKLEDERCTKNLNESAFFFNKTCFSMANTLMLDVKNATFQKFDGISPTEEFFENYVLEKTPTMDELGGINWKVLIALALAWLITALVLVKGVEMIGKAAFITATVPYVIIVILFVRCVTLPGAKIGLDYYLLNPDFSAIFKASAWKAAATQNCYSLAVGFGGLLSLSSFNPRSHNCFRDAIIISTADGFMSVFGGTAVFSTLGFIAHQLQLDINQVIQSGLGLAFMAYPEAMSRMPITWLWSFLFFTMLLLLGISSQFGLAEVMCTALYDQFPSTRKYKSVLVVCVCFVLFLCGSIMTTRSGIFYFKVFDDYSASFALALLLLMEISLIMYIYGGREYIKDLRTMFGYPKDLLGKLFGPTGYYVRLIWMVIAPMVAIAIFGVTFYAQLTESLEYGKNERKYLFPDWAYFIGWSLSIIPLLLLPIFVLYNSLKFRNQGKSQKELLRLQPKWPSYDRHAATIDPYRIYPPGTEFGKEKHVWTVKGMEKTTVDGNTSITTSSSEDSNSIDVNIFPKL